MLILWENMAGQNSAKPNLLRQLYDRCMEWLETPYGPWVLFGIAIVESSFFPIPPDVFLIALCIAVPRKSFLFVGLCTVGSVLGGAFGYGLGFWFMDSVGQGILSLYHLGDKYEAVQHLYSKYDAFAIGAAGFTPLPYKLFTITAGAFKIDFVTFMIVSCLARGGRFFLVGLLMYLFGKPMKKFINTYFNLLTVVFFILLVGGFLLLSTVFKS